MIRESVRLVSAFMAHADHGLNEMAQSIPRTNPGGADDIAPPVVTIYNDADHKEVAKDLSAPTVPALVVWGDSSAEIDLQGYKRAYEVILAAAFITDDQQDPLVMNGACGYILRGGVLTMGRFNSSGLSAGHRNLNGIKILKVHEVTEQRVTAAVGRQKMWGFISITLHVVETLS